MDIMRRCRAGCQSQRPGNPLPDPSSLAHAHGKELRDEQPSRARAASAWTDDCLPFLGSGTNCPDPAGPNFDFAQAPALMVE
jgi:hypothetical protein